MKKLLRKQITKWLPGALIAALPAIPAGAQNIDFFKSDYTQTNSAAFSIVKGWDNNFIVAGGVVSNAGGSANSDLLLVKINPSGDTIWKRTYGLPTLDESAYCVLTPLGNQVMVTGTSDNRNNAEGAAFLMNVDPATGNLQWQKQYPVSGKRTALVDMKRLNDGFILCGTITDTLTNNTDAWLVKTDLNGNMVWSNNYGGANYDDAWQVERTSDGGFLLAGGSYSYRTGTSQDDAWLVKTTGTGDQVWIKHYGNADTVDWIWSMAPVGNAGAPTGYVFTGVKNRNPNSIASEMFLARVDTAGNIVWDIPMKGTFNYREGLSIEPTLHHTFYVVGTELLPNGSLGLLAMDIDTNGNVLNQIHYSSPNPEWVRPRSLYINNLSDAYIAGQLIRASNTMNAFVTRIRDIDGIPNGLETVDAPTPIYVYPNPATKLCTVISDADPIRHIIMRDATGREVRNILSPGTQYERIALDDLPAGVYFITVFTKGISPVNLRLIVQ